MNCLDEVEKSFQKNGCTPKYRGNDYSPEPGAKVIKPAFKLNFDYFSRFYIDNLSDTDLSSIFSLAELLSLQEGYFCFDNLNFSFTRKDIKLLIDYFSRLLT